MAISLLRKFSPGLAMITASAGLIAVSIPAYAGSGAVGPGIVYGSGSYGSYGGDTHTKPKKHKHKQHKRKKHTRKKHKHVTESNRGYITSIAGHSSAPHSGYSTPSHSTLSHSTLGHSRYGNSVPACPSGSRRAADGYCMATNSGSYGAAHASILHTSSARITYNASHTSSTHSSSAVNHANKSLSIAPCPTSDYTPQVGKVLGCYLPTPVVRPRPVPHTRVHYQQIQVVRPVIYVRYPVPVPVVLPIMAPSITPCGGAISYSRYGNAWPQAGGGCGGW